MRTLNSQFYIEEPGVPERPVRSIVADIDQPLPTERLQQTAALLVRELHDGVLQTLTAAVLQLDAAASLIETDARSAQMRVGDAQAMIRQQQRELRNWAERLELAAQPIPQAPA